MRAISLLGRYSLHDMFNLFVIFMHVNRVNETSKPR